MFDRIKKTTEQCDMKAKEIAQQCGDMRTFGDQTAACIKSANAVLEESNKILQDTNKKIDSLIESLYSWRDRALKAEARVKELEAQHRTEMCENGYDCVTLGKERSRADAAEAKLDLWRKLANDRSAAYREMRNMVLATEAENKRLLDSIDYARTKDRETMRLGCKLGIAEKLLRDLLADCSDASVSEHPVWPEFWGERIKEYFGRQEEL